MLLPKFKDSMIAAYSLNRSELLLATTYHAEMGPLIRSMLNNLVASGIEGKLRDVEATQAAGKVVHIKDAKYFNYNELSGEQGRDVLARGLDQMYPSEVLEQQIELEGDPDTKAKLKKELDRLNRAKKLAKLLFTNFDMLNIILGHNQFQTKTRAHNNGLSIDDPVAIENQVASYVHNGERYGGNPKDWRAWILPYFKRFPKNARLGAGGDPTRIRELQHSIILHQECFYDTDNFFGKVELPSMQYFDEHGHVVYPLEYQSFFPDTLDLSYFG
ncbi:MAG: hypothetical protein H6773_04490 [Pseudomonadales bacterium]|nr:hypothetical protein [Pseudomonadales bacterium]